MKYCIHSAEELFTITIVFLEEKEHAMAPTRTRDELCQTQPRPGKDRICFGKLRSDVVVQRGLE